MRLSSLIVAMLLGGATASAEDARQRAREDLEQQLKAMVGTPPTKVRVTYVALDEPNMKVTEAVFELDGSSLPTPGLSKLNTEGEHAIFVGDIEPGEHTLVSKLVVENTASHVVSAEGGLKWPITLNIKFNALPGIEVAYQVKPAHNGKATDMKQRITMTAPHSLRMLAKLDDGSMPEPMKRKIEAVETPVAVAAVDPKASAANATEKRKAAQEAKAQAAKDAREAKVRAAAEAKEARLRAAQEKQDRAASKRTKVTEEEKAPPAMVAQAPTPTSAPTPALAPAVVDAGPPAPIAAPVDAGSAMVAATKAALPAVETRSADDKGLPMPLVVGGVVALLGLIIFLASRRKKS
jgi:hypothetical protein